MVKGIVSFSILCAGILLGSCGTGKQVNSKVSPVEGEWNIVEVDGKAVNMESGSSPTIGFDVLNHRIYGNSGCNRMMGSFEIIPSNSRSLVFGQIGSTRMACPDMATEKNVLAAMDKVKSYKEVSGKGSARLALCDEKGHPVMMIERAPLNVSSLNGEWRVISIKGSPVGKSETEPFIGFDINEKRIYGNAGCNNINGSYSQEESKPLSLRFGQVISTMMACPDMDTEAAMLKALDQVKSFKFDGKDKVELYGEKNDLLFSLARR